MKRSNLVKIGFKLEFVKNLLLLFIVLEIELYLVDLSILSLNTKKNIRKIWRSRKEVMATIFKIMDMYDENEVKLLLWQLGPTCLLRLIYLLCRLRHLFFSSIRLMYRLSLEFYVTWLLPLFLISMYQILAKKKEKRCKSIKIAT